MFRLVSCFSIKKLPSADKVVYLTFDDGPEPEITEYVLSILKEYNAKATFFCVGKNFEKHPDLVKLIRNNGHSFGNHSFSHIGGHEAADEDYLNDITKGKEIIQTNLFRPPWGELTLHNLFKIKKSNTIIMWDISSCDYMTEIDWNKHCQKMVNKTKAGSIILFHFNLKNAIGTKEILPKYIYEISKLGYKFAGINVN